MSILPLIAASLLGAPNQPDPAPAWLAPEPLLTFVEQHDDMRRSDGASSRTYLRATGGLITTSSSSGPGEEIDFDEGYLLSLGLGWRLGQNDSGLGFSIEIDGIWTDTDADQGNNPAVRDVSVLGVLLDGILDFPLGDQLSIYAGGGIGAAWLDVGTESDGLSDFNDEDGPFLAWQAKGGLAWHLSTRTSLQVGYRFLNVDDAQLDDSLSSASFDLETQQHALELGLIFGF